MFVYAKQNYRYGAMIMIIKHLTRKEIVFVAVDQHEDYLNNNNIIIKIECSWNNI